MAGAGDLERADADFALARPEDDGETAAMTEKKPLVSTLLEKHFAPTPLDDLVVSHAAFRTESVPTFSCGTRRLALGR